MLQIKYFIGTIAVIMTFIGYIPYLTDTVKGKTKPHVYSWILWGILALISFSLQLSVKAGIGSMVTLSAALTCFVIALLGLKHGKKTITKLDTYFFIASLLALIIWYYARQPLVSAVLILGIGVVGFIPTIRKSWNNPHTETLSTWLLNSIRHGLSIFALQNYALLSWLFPATWVATNGLFGLMLIVRRRQLG